jgi:ParB-like chromosome segregation protein Spo0J
MNAKDSVPQRDEVVEHETVEKSLGQVPLNCLDVDAEKYGFREDDELSKDGVRDLADDIAASDIDTPLTVQPLPDGTFRLSSGHRRFGELRCLRP